MQAAAMSAKIIGSASRSLPDGAQNLTDGLAVEHRALGRVAGHHQAATVDPHVTRVSSILSIVDTDQFARAIGEIEQAAAALREGAPDLEPWTPDATAAQEHHQPRSIWLFVGTIWI